MRAVGINAFGDNDKLEIIEVPRPEPKDNEVLIKVKAAAVNPVDWKIREGYLQKMLPHAFPLVLGWDAAGVVESVGRSVTRLKAGDEVYAYTRKDTVQWGSFAEYVAVPEGSVAKKPKSLSFAEAATVPLVALTAWQMLFDAGGLQAGETVLIHAAAGGVGGYATEFAAWKRAEVIATAGTANHEYVHNLGAKHVVDYQTCDFRQVVREFHPGGVDLALDTVGGETLKRTVEVIAKNGRLVGIVEPLDAKALGRGDLKTKDVFVTGNAAQLEQIAALIDDRRVTAHLTLELPLDQAKKAMALVQAGHVRGKIALIV